ncbi:hypothetical protein MK541_00405 [Streptococcus gallolyticus subsp. gallolyticus]|uniref:hypothetical protein n=1 Tax=Streptococcus gallolyticus TaxID=315405 RepID=UPI00228448DB|nr:hypothetical protein [Streptococcus gallolyticus]MCY7150630.1 hypothetical protein [Streptococcus gallolyticus subsp. gallolyticus]
MMKGNYYRNFIVTLVIGIIFLAGGVVTAIVNYRNNTVTALSAKNQVFNGENTSADNGAMVVVNVYGIYEEPIADIDGHNTVIWLIAYDNGYVGAEAKEDDQQIAALISKGSDLSQHPQQLMVKYFDTNYNNSNGITSYSSAMETIVEPTTDLGERFSYSSYLSLSAANSDKQVNYIVAVIIGGIGVFLIVLSFVTKAKTTKAFSEFYAEYPELNGSIEHLQDIAGYSNDKLKLTIYRHHLVSYYGAFAIMDLNDIQQLYHYVIKIKRTFITIGRNSMLIGITENKKQKSISIKNIGKTTDSELQPMFEYVAQHFPEIKLGKD